MLKRDCITRILLTKHSPLFLHNTLPRRMVLGKEFRLVISNMLGILLISKGKVGQGVGLGAQDNSGSGGLQNYT